MRRLFHTTLLISGTLVLLYSCAKSDSGDGLSLEEMRRRENARDETESQINGMYMAKFETLNPHINGTLPGSLTFYRNGDRLLSFVRLFAGKPRTWHQQGVYMGRRCPNLGDDLNKDGIIDIEEGMKVFGKMVIPLDANLNSQMGGKNFFPLADLSGYYHYERVASFSRLFSDLKSEDFESDDHIVKLASGQQWSFHNKVVVVLGVDEETPLPETVAGLGKRKPFQALPITCGIIKKVVGQIGTPNTDEIPGPVAEVEEGQDHPSPPIEEGPNGETGNSGGSGTNDTDDGEVSNPDRPGSGGHGGNTGGGNTGGEDTGGEDTGGEDTGGEDTGGEDTGGDTGGGDTGGGDTGTGG